MSEPFSAEWVYVTPKYAHRKLFRLYLIILKYE